MKAKPKMAQDQRLLHRVLGFAWLLLGCVASVAFSYLPNSSHSLFNPEAWFAAFPLAWTVALLTIRYQNYLPSSLMHTLTREKSRVEKVLQRVLYAGGCLVAVPFLFIGCATSAWLAPFPPRFQVEQDHGVHLPVSAIVLHRENTGVPWMDSHASADVVMAASDLPKFVKQLEPAPPEHLFGEPWQKKIGENTAYSCRSKSSDGRFYVTTTPGENGTVIVKLGTVTD